MGAIKWVRVLLPDGIIGVHLFLGGKDQGLRVGLTERARYRVRDR